MVEGKRVAVVVPAFEEEHLVAETLRGIPDFVDRIYVVDDASPDETAARARAVADPRVEVIVHEQNGGVGAAIVTGYLRAREERIDVTCVMAADNQMDPDELASLVGPVARGEVDYTKANRLITGEAWTLIPHSRYLGNAVLSLLTKIASGYWHVADSQAGYTALSLAALDRLDLERIYRRYGFPNDMLVHLNVVSASVRDVPSRPIYGVGERSGIKIRPVAPRIAWLLFKGFWWRMKEKYVIRDFHPLVFFYVLGTLMTVLGLLLGLVVAMLADLLRQRDHHRDDRARRAAPDLRHAVHAVRDVVRPGVEQGAPLSDGGPQAGADAPVDDPFRLLERDSDETLAWQSRQNEDRRRRCSATGTGSTSFAPRSRRTSRALRDGAGAPRRCIGSASTPARSSCRARLQGRVGLSSIPDRRRSTGSSRRLVERASPTASRSVATSRACSM